MIYDNAMSTFSNKYPAFKKKKKTIYQNQSVAGFTEKYVLSDKNSVYFSVLMHNIFCWFITKYLGTYLVLIFKKCRIFVCKC